MDKFAFLLSTLLALLVAGTSEGQVVHANFRESLVRYDTDSGELAFFDAKAPGGAFAKAHLELPEGCGSFKTWQRLAASACETGRVTFAKGSLTRDVQVNLVCGYDGISVVGPEGLRLEGEVLAGEPDQEAVFAVVADRPAAGLASVSGGAVPEGADAVFDRRTDTLYRVGGASLGFDDASRRMTFSGSGRVSLSVEPKLLEKRYRIAYRPVNPNGVFKTPPVGWMTWYAVKFGASDDVVMRNACGFMENFRGYTDERPVMWVDWEWFHGKFYCQGEDGQDMLAPRTTVYPRGLKPVAEDLERMGFTPALWVSPSNDVATNALLKAHREWILAERLTWCGCLWGDPTAPGFCEEYVPHLFKLYQSWGYKAFKWDCIPASVHVYADFRDKLHDPTLLPEEVLVRMVAAGRRTVGPDCYLEACSGETDRSVLAGLDLFDAARIGGDIFKWSEFLASGVNRLLGYYPLHQSAFWADVDNLVLRAEFSTLAQARTRATVYALAGVPITMGDEIAALDAPRLELLKRVMPVVPMHPASLAKTSCPGGLMESTADFARDFGSWRLKAWSNFTTNAALTAEFAAPGCAAWDFWNDRLVAADCGEKLAIAVVPGDTVLWRVTPLEKTGPTLVSVSRHVTQGGYEIERLASDAAGASGAVKCPGGETVKVTFLLPAGAAVASASHPYELSGRVLRLKVGSPEKATVPFSFRCLPRAIAQ